MNSWVLFFLCGWSCQATSLHSDAQGNPIRKVVTLLQDMQKEIEAEGKKEEDLYNKFMCYCDGNTADMTQSVSDAAAKIVDLKSKLEAETAERTQLTQELMQHKIDREAATGDLKEATAVREKEHAEYVSSTGEQKSTIDQLTGAIAALEKGMGKSALMQMSEKSLSQLREVLQRTTAVNEDDKEEVMSFLDSKQNPFGDYGARSGEIVGILKAMKDEMDKDLNGVVADEETAQAGFEELASAKKQQIAAATEAIETKTARSGTLAVSIATTKDDIEDTTKNMNETQAFVANLAAECATKKTEWAERSKTRTEEIAAISEAITILNDDDALDLFKKTLSLPQTSKVGFLQKRSSIAVVSEVQDKIEKLSKHSAHANQLNLIAYALKAKKVDFSKVIKMIDDMSAQLKQEQKDDDAQKRFCDSDIAASEASKKDTEEAIAESKATIEEATDASATTAEEIKTLQAEVKALDTAVAEANEQRKNEHGDFLQYQTEMTAALQLIEKAKNRLFKFYRPSLHKEAPQKELTAEEQILADQGRSDLIATEAPEMIAGTTQTVYAQIRVHTVDTPPPPPETWDAYQKKDGKSNGVIALMEMLAKDLQGDMTEAENEEKTSQRDYEKLMATSTKQRAGAVQSITNKEAAKADLDIKIEDTKELQRSQEAQLMNIEAYISKLHGSCDFLINNYDLRKAARSNEIDSLSNAKSVLSGADYA